MFHTGPFQVINSVRHKFVITILWLASIFLSAAMRSLLYGGIDYTVYKFWVDA